MFGEHAFLLTNNDEVPAGIFNVLYQRIYAEAAAVRKINHKQPLSHLQDWESAQSVVFFPSM